MTFSRYSWKLCCLPSNVRACRNWLAITYKPHGGDYINSNCPALVLHTWTIILSQINARVLKGLNCGWMLSQRAQLQRMEANKNRLLFTVSRVYCYFSNGFDFPVIASQVTRVDDDPSWKLARGGAMVPERVKFTWCGEIIGLYSVRMVF